MVNGTVQYRVCGFAAKDFHTGLWYHAVWHTRNKIKEKHIASVFRVENSGSLFLCNIDTHLSDYMLSRPSGPEHEHNTCLDL